jgi:hypothetical protein
MGVCETSVSLEGRTPVPLAEAGGRPAPTPASRAAVVTTMAMSRLRDVPVILTGQ